MPSDNTLNHALVALFEHIASSSKPIIIDYETAHKWHSEALKSFIRLGLISTASAAQSIECKGCENHCFIDVITRKYDSVTRTFVVCEDSEIQSQIGRLEVPIEHLKQWQSSTKHLAKVVSHLLGFDDNHHKTIKDKIQLGMMKSTKGRRWVSLQFEPLSLEINQYLIPIKELLYFEGEQFLIDRLRVDELLERTPQTNTKEYTPSTDKREARKLKTKAMYQDWNDAYLKLKRDKPNASDSWCAKQIAKMDIAQGKSAGTIVKNMKN